MENQFINMGSRIKCRRKELNIKQSELAEMVIISNNHMSAIETGSGKPSFDVFLAICDVLKTTPDYLLLGNMYSKSTSQNIIDKLQLCSPDDLEIIENIIEIFVQRNSLSWNAKNRI